MIDRSAFVQAAKKLLAAAGYPKGFEVGMDCPNNRYVNDERICQAVVSMLAKVGVKVTRGCLPGATTLYGFSDGSRTKLCMRWLIPMPVLPAMQAGSQPPLGVMDTSQPSASAA